MLAQFRKTGAMRIEGRVAYRINKGSPKGEKTPGKDLGNKFRLSAVDPNEEVADFESGEKLLLDKLFGELDWVDGPTKAQPFATASKIPMRILGFDHLARYDPLRFYEEISAEVAKWAAATVFSASQMLAKTDALGQWLMAERVDGLMVNYEPDEKPVPVYYNIPNEPFYNKGYGNGQECYLYEAKLYPWTWQGRLQFRIPELDERAGLMAYGVFTTTSKYDINNLTAELVQLVTAIHPVPLSQVPVVLQRVQERIASLGFDQKQSLTERRKKKQGRNEWLVHLALEPKIVNAFLTIQRRRENELLEAALQGKMPILDRGEQPALAPPAEPEPGPSNNRQIPAGIEDTEEVAVEPAEIEEPPPFYDEEIAFDEVEEDGLFEEENDKEEGADAYEMPEFIKDINIEEIRNLSSDEWPAYVGAQITTIDTVGKRQAGVKRLGITIKDLKTPEGRLQSFLTLYLYGENISKQMKVDDAAKKALEDLIPLLNAIAPMNKAARDESGGV